MDVYCQNCAEPWDVFSLHDFSKSEKTLWDAGQGCPACNGDKSLESDSFITDLMSVASDLLGDDIDSIASLMNDAEYFGLFDD